MLAAAALCFGCTEQLAKPELATRSVSSYRSLQFSCLDAQMSACSTLPLAMLPAAAALLPPSLGLAAGAGLASGDSSCSLLLQLLLQLQRLLPQ
jgi:hypothetical protein